MQRILHNTRFSGPVEVDEVRAALRNHHIRLADITVDKTLCVQEAEGKGYIPFNDVDVLLVKRARVRVVGVAVRQRFHDDDDLPMDDFARGTLERLRCKGWVTVFSKQAVSLLTITRCHELDVDAGGYAGGPRDAALVEATVTRDLEVEVDEVLEANEIQGCNIHGFLVG